MPLADGEPTCAPSSSPSDAELLLALDRLCRQFPGLPRDVIVSVLGDSFQVVVDAADAPLVDKAEELARIRLEVRTGRAARRDTEAAG